MINELINKKDKKVQEYVFLLVALKLSNQSFLPQLGDFKHAFPKVDKAVAIDKLVGYFEKAAIKT